MLFDAASARSDVIRLEVGEPSFPTPPHVIEAAARAAHAGQTGYGPNGGLPELRELLAEKIRRVDGYAVEPRQIVVTPGAMNALFSTYLALLDPGDEVLLPTPGFPNMDGMVRLIGGEPVFYPLFPDDGFLPRVDELARRCTARTKVLFLNTPANPTGSVFPGELVSELVEFCERQDLWLLSDEVYDEIVLDPALAHIAAASFDRSGRVVSVYSFSKVYAMTGWRVGYAVAPQPVAEILCTLQEPQVSCPSTISQLAAVATLTGPHQPYEEMVEAYRARRRRAVTVARDEGLRCVEPGGTIYMMVDVSEAGVSSLDFALRLLDQQGVSVAPGSVFGPGGEGWVRISLAASEEDVAEGLRRIAGAVRSAAEVRV